MVRANMDRIAQYETSEFSSFMSDLGAVAYHLAMADTYKTLLDSGDTAAILSYFSELETSWNRIRTINLNTGLRDDIDEEVKNLENDINVIRNRLNKGRQHKVSFVIINKIKDLHKRILQYKQWAMGMPVRKQTNETQRFRNVLGLNKGEKIEIEDDS